MEFRVSIQSGEELPPNDPGIIYLCADGFYKASQKLAVPLGAGPNAFAVLPPPGVVLMAHAAELYLKAALIALRNHTPQQLEIHDLEQLYRLLPDDDRAEIRRRLGVQAGDMSQLLPSIANASVAWRYLYENVSQPLNQQLLERFTAAVRVIASKVAGFRPPLAEAEKSTGDEGSVAI
jgi:HEPN domain-containing protein